MKKRIIATLMAATLAVSMLAGCSNTGSSAPAPPVAARSNCSLRPAGPDGDKETEKKD